MPINQFNFKPKGFGINQETTGTVKTGSGNYYNDYYYRSPEYDRLTGGIGAGNSSYGLRNTTNANRLDPNRELYERTLGELVSTLVGNSDTTKVKRYLHILLILLHLSILPLTMLIMVIFTGLVILMMK